MNAEYRKKLFDVLNQIDELAEGVSGKNGDTGQERGAAGKPDDVKTDGAKTDCENPDPAEPGENEKPEKGQWYGGDTVWVGGANHDNKKRYSPQFKEMIVKLHAEECVPFKQITDKYGVSKATVTKWCSDFRYHNRKKLEQKDKELSDSKDDCAKLKEENVFLRSVIVMMLGGNLEGKA